MPLDLGGSLIRVSSLATLALLAVMSAAIAGTAPERSKGISMHFLPKRVAEISGQKWGLVADVSQEAMQTPEEFLSFVRRQPPEVQSNGIWVVVSHPDAYGEQEKKFFVNVEDLCRREKIALFVARAADLPQGWKRSD